MKEGEAWGVWLHNFIYIDVKKTCKAKQQLLKDTIQHPKYSKKEKLKNQKKKKKFFIKGIFFYNNFGVNVRKSDR